MSHGGRYGTIFLFASALSSRSAGATLRWYGLSVALSASALALMVLLRPLMEHSIFFLFLVAVAISALYGGLGPGLVATVLSTAACDYFFLPPDNVPLSGPEEAVKTANYWMDEGVDNFKAYMYITPAELSAAVAAALDA